MPAKNRDGHRKPNSETIAYRPKARACSHSFTTPVTPQLPKFLDAARRLPERARLLSLLLLIGILFSGVVSPAVAHTQETGVVHADEVLNVHESLSTAAHDASRKAPDMPGQPASHHHCTIALEVIAPAILAVPEMPEGLLGPAISRTLASYAQARRPSHPPPEPVPPRDHPIGRAVTLVQGHI